MSGKFEGEYEIISSETDDIVDKLDDFNPADMVYDENGIQIYKNDSSTIMLKVISSTPLKFVALFVERNLSNEEAIDEFEEVIDATQKGENQESV